MVDASRARVLGLVCARGGSRGVPHKNLKAVGGKPLIVWSIDVAKRCSSIDHVMVSTEDAEIARIAKAAGADVPWMRPAALAQDATPEWQVWQHVLREWEQRTGALPEVLVSLPPTSPLRAVEDVEACVQELRSHADADVVITVTPAARNPYFNMVTLTDGWARLMIPSPGPVHRRQDAPEAFDIVTVAYAARPAFVLGSDHLTRGRMRAVVVPSERAVDIDTQLDLAFAEFLLEKRVGARR